MTGGSKPDFSNIKLRNGAYMSRITNMTWEITITGVTDMTGGGDKHVWGNKHDKGNKI